MTEISILVPDWFLTAFLVALAFTVIVSAISAALSVWSARLKLKIARLRAGLEHRHD